MKSNINQATDNIFDRAKQAKSIIDVMREYYPSHTLTQQAKNQYRTTSIFYPGHNDTCTVIFTDTNTFHDYKSDKSGDIIDLIANVTNQTLIDTARSLAGDSGYTSEYKNAKKSYEANIEKKYLKGHENLKKYSDILQYLHSRRISDETIEKFKIGALVNSKTGEVRISIPYFNERGTNIVYGTTRRFSNHDSAKYLKEFIPQELKDSGYTEPLMYLNTINVKDKNLLIIGEGVFDILSAVQEGYSGLCYVGGSTNSQNLPVIQRFASQFKKIILTFDNDENKIINSGQNFTLKTANHLLQYGITNFYAVRKYGESNKDLSDFYSAGGELSELFSNAVNGVTFTTKIFTEKRPLKGDISTVEKGKNKRELKEFYLQLQKSLLDDDDLMNECKGIFESKYSKNTIKEFAKEKSKDDVINETVDSYLNDNIIQATGSPKHKEFFVYDKKHGIKKRVNESYLYAEMKERFNINENIYIKATDEIHSKTFIRDKADMPVFNMVEAFNFKSKVYDFVQKKLVEHSPDFNFTTYADFDFDPTADCPTFKNFLNVFCNGNESRLNTIKDMLGYLLAPHCKGQAVLCLLGSGANGKGVFETVIKGIFDALKQGFVTDVNPDDMSNPNQLIRLESSIVNFNSDCSRYVSKVACANIKRASGGDSINGNKKFYDIGSFQTRAKHIYGFNEQPIFYDTTLGMKRRLVFVKLENNFLNNPDIFLPEKILSEKEGIFNFMLECYYSLKARNFQIRRCDDQAEMMKNFEVESNIIAQFIDENVDELKATDIEKKSLYDDFKEYFKNSGERSKRPSFRGFNAEIKKLYPDVETRKSHGKTFWDFERVTLSSETETETVEAIEVDPVEVSEKEQGEIFYFMTRIYVNAVDNNAVEYDDKLLKAVAGLKSLDKIKEVIERLKNEATTENEKKFYEACLIDVKNAKKKIA